MSVSVSRPCGNVAAVPETAVCLAAEAGSDERFLFLISDTSTCQLPLLNHDGVQDELQDLHDRQHVGIKEVTISKEEARLLREYEVHARSIAPHACPGAEGDGVRKDSLLNGLASVIKAIRGNILHPTHPMYANVQQRRSIVNIVLEELGRQQATPKPAYLTSEDDQQIRSGMWNSILDIYTEQTGDGRMFSLVDLAIRNELVGGVTKVEQQTCEPEPQIQPRLFDI